MVKFIFTFGLPGSGKSTYLKENYPDVIYFNSYDEKLIKESVKNNKYLLISADNIKYILSKRRGLPPESYHEESVKLAKELVYKVADVYKKGEDFYGVKVIMDGGAINSHYTQDIIDYIKNDKDSGCIITCIAFDTPVGVCIDRISQRERKVPIESIYAKNQELQECFYRYSRCVDVMKKVNYYENKYIVLDMDGTIVSYTKGPKDIDGNIDFVNSKLFEHSLPVENIIMKISNKYNPENIFILTACPNSISWQEKNKWLDRYLENVPKNNRYFVGNKEKKDVFLKQLCLLKHWKYNEVVMVDDDHNTLDKLNAIGINAIHPSNIEALFNDKIYIG